MSDVKAFLTPTTLRIEIMSTLQGVNVRVSTPDLTNHHKLGTCKACGNLDDALKAIPELVYMEIERVEDRNNG